MYTDAAFRIDLHADKHAMKNEMLLEEDHRMHMCQDLKGNYYLQARNGR